MKTFLSLLSIVFYIVSLTLFYWVDWRLGAGLTLFSVAMSIDIALRDDGVREELLRIARDIYSLVS